MARFTIRMYQPDHADQYLILPFLLSLNEPPLAVPGFGLGEYIFTSWRDLTPPVTETLALALDQSGTLAALCWLEPPNEIALSIAPGLTGTEDERSLFQQLLDFAVSRFETLVPDRTEPIGMTIGYDDQRDIQYLSDLGMVTEGDIRHHTFRWLQGQQLGRTPLPDGFHFVDMDDDSRILERVAVHLAVWPESTMDPRRYLQIRNAPYHRPGLDLCVESPVGQLVAFALGWFDPVGKSCQFEPIGCHPEFRGKGIAHALVQEATHRAIEFGCNRAYINCYAKNDAGNALYHSAGYDLVGKWQWWHLPADGTAR